MLLPVRHPGFRLLATLPCLVLLTAGHGLHLHGIAEQIAEWLHAGGHHCCHHHTHAPTGEQPPAAPDHDPDDCNVCQFYAQAKSVAVAIYVVRVAPLSVPQTNPPTPLFTPSGSFSPASPRGPPSVG